MSTAEDHSEHQGNGQDENDSSDNSFDFENHRRSAEDQYRRIRGRYDDFASTLESVLVSALNDRKIPFNSVDARAKDVESFARKAATRSEDDPDQPKYEEPLKHITDLAGIRVITFFPNTVQDVGDVLRAQFEVIEHSDHGSSLKEEERFGYLSEHFLVKMKSERTDLPEYNRYRDLIAEVQVRTILQHAWAEIEHDIQYKSSTTTPSLLRRRFMALAGLLEIADREFQAIQEDDEKLSDAVKSSVAGGRYDQVEISANAVKSYLDAKVGEDNRVAPHSYEWVARMLRRLGFQSLEQVDQCVDGFDGDKLSRIEWGGHRQGPIWRFRSMLLAGMGEVLIERIGNNAEAQSNLRDSLEDFKEHYDIGDFDPRDHDESS